MSALIILGVIVTIIILVLLIPVGAEMSFAGGELNLSAMVLGKRIKLYPKVNPKTESDEEAPLIKPKKKKLPKADKPKRFKLKFSLDELFLLVKKLMLALGKFRKMRVSRFKMHYIAAGGDPYNTAMTFAYVNAALSSLAPLAVERFHVDDCDIYTNLDYSQSASSVELAMAVSIRIGQIFAVINTAIFGVLGILIKNQRRLAKVNKASKQESEEAGTTDINQSEERNDSNG